MSELRPARAGEELDVGSLQPWIEQQLGFEGPIRVEQFPSGHSNLTYLLHVAGRELVLRRPPVGTHVQSGHDMSREYRILEGVNPVWSKTPEPLVFCDDMSIIGAPFYLMTRVHGTILRGSSPAPDAETMRQICESFVSTFAEIHAIDTDGAGLASLGRPEGYVRRQVEGWAALRRLPAKQGFWNQVRGIGDGPRGLQALLSRVQPPAGPLPELADSSAREMEAIAGRKADLITFGRGMVAVTSGIIWLAVAGLLLMAVRRTPKEQRRRSLITALIALLVCGIALGGGLFWLFLLLD